MPPKTDVVESRISEALGKANLAKERPNLKQIAREFDVPYQRFKARYHGRYSRHAPKPHQTLLDPIQEQSLLRWWSFLDSFRRRPSHQEIAEAANRMIRPRIANKNWVYDFEKRCLSATRVANYRPTNKDRSDSEDIGELSIWFDRLEQYLAIGSKDQILSENIYNFDETGFQLGVARSTRGPSRHRDQRFSSKEKGETVTVIECACANGSLIKRLNRRQMARNDYFSSTVTLHILLQSFFNIVSIITLSHGLSYQI